MTLQAEFQVVVLAAGRGSRMPEVTSGKPKCLLPVGTRPLVWYPLYKLQQSGFTDVIFVVQENHKSEIQNVLDKTELEIKIEYFTINGKEDIGTADSLRMLHDKLKSDVLVVSCDFITDISLKGVLDIFRMHDASAASLFFHPQAGESLIVPGPKSKHKPERDLVGIDTQTNRLVFLASASDFERELLPHIVKKQLSKPPKVIEGKSIVSKYDSEDIFNYAKEDEFSLLIRETSAYNDHTGDFKSTYHGDSIRCYAFIAPQDSFGVRVNTLPTYWAIHNKVNEKWNKITDGLSLVLKHPKSENKSSQVDDKCVIWEGAKLHEKTSFKNSIIGSSTEVCSFSRVFNSIIMNNVLIKEKVALENCIVSDGAVIESGCKINGCLIGSNHTLPENSEHSQEVLTDSDRLMEF
ncbi:translation initiation factor eIF-2B subunit gamma [Asbolus verrucosus]|uniref:Translation initiation factor eIF2B subunit gamma n=1 Tax=Asbolus verrucosus TaxID=1661398 RepID=A0A482W9P3_ASBVE|nr:translation initiation factor eIF-2B subunit gamma [Asbolus verrucosus]